MLKFPSGYKELEKQRHREIALEFDFMEIKIRQFLSYGSSHASLWIPDVHPACACWRSDC